MKLRNMKLRNKNTGEIFRFGCGVRLNGEYYDSLAKINEDWEDYEPAEPLIKEERIRKAVRAWAEANVLCEDIKVHNFATGTRFSIGQYAIEFMGYYICDLVKDRTYTITELCGEEE